ASTLCVLLKKFYRITHGDDGLGGIIRNFAAELLFKSHDEFDRVETVRTEVVDQACAFGHLVWLDAQVLHDDLLNPLGNVTHRLDLSLNSACGSLRAYPVKASILIDGTHDRLNQPSTTSSTARIANGPSMVPTANRSPQPSRGSVNTLP